MNTENSKPSSATKCCRRALFDVLKLSQVTLRNEEIIFTKATHQASKSPVQTNDLDLKLRTRLWNVLITFYWAEMKYARVSNDIQMRRYLERLWHDYFGKALDTLSDDWSSVYSSLRTHFFDCAWNDVYDFIEVTSDFYPAPSRNEGFRVACNHVLKKELSGYRFVADQIAPITSDQEIHSIENAQRAVSNFPGVIAHLQQALALLSDRKQPDYRNSIKESISAIEAICRVIAKNPKASLSEALKAFGSKVVLHPALSSAFDKLYGYTSDAEGIRHGLLDSPNLQQEDAIFMLASCSAFVSYLVAKCARAGLKL